MSLINKVIKNIEKRRNELNLSVDALAKKANIPTGTLNNIRYKKHNDIRLETAYAISIALNFTLDDLVK